MAKITFMNGREMKTIDPWHSDGEMWKYSTEPPASEKKELYSRVAAVYRAVNFTASTLANMPFAVVKGGTDIDTSDEWKNAVGFMPNPRHLLRMWTQSLLMTNKAFGFQETKGSRLLNLRYIAPSTITKMKTDETGALAGFERTIGTTATYYPIEKGFCNIFYIFNLNWENELLPDDTTPFKAMMNAAGIGYYADLFIRDFFERGGIKPTILTFDGVMDKVSATEVESVWTKVIRGWYKYMGKVFNGKFTPITIGDGVESLQKQNIYDNALRNIAIAVGMPQDALLQNADSYATAQVHKSTWFTDTLTPMAYSMQEPLNNQIFERLGYRFEFRPEGAEPSMEEESQRVAGAKTLYQILSDARRVDADKAAIEAFGIDMPLWFTWEEKEPEPIPPQLTGQQPAGNVDDMEDVDYEPYEEPINMRSVFNVNQLREMKTWQDIAYRKLKRGNSLVFDWTPKDISAEVAAQIKARLDVATTEAEIKAAFEVDPPSMPVVETNDNEIKALAEAINKLAEKHDAQPVIVNLPATSFTLNEKAVEVKAEAPIVNVNVPEQPAPVVNVTNEVNPTPVEVINNIDVKPAPVKVDKPKRARVVRDREGRIEGLEAQ
jgi:hypothetical protein